MGRPWGGAVAVGLIMCVVVLPFERAWADERVDVPEYVGPPTSSFDPGEVEWDAALTELMQEWREAWDTYREDLDEQQQRVEEIMRDAIEAAAPNFYLWNSHLPTIELYERSLANLGSSLRDTIVGGILGAGFLEEIEKRNAINTGEHASRSRQLGDQIIQHIDEHYLRCPSGTPPTEEPHFVTFGELKGLTGAYGGTTKRLGSNEAGSSTAEHAGSDVWISGTAFEQGIGFVIAVKMHELTHVSQNLTDPFASHWCLDPVAEAISEVEADDRVLRADDTAHFLTHAQRELIEEHRARYFGRVPVEHRQPLERGVYAVPQYPTCLVLSMDQSIHFSAPEWYGPQCYCSVACWGPEYLPQFVPVRMPEGFVLSDRRVLAAMNSEAFAVGRVREPPSSIWFEASDYTQWMDMLRAFCEEDPAPDYVDNGDGTVAVWIPTCAFETDLPPVIEAVRTSYAYSHDDCVFVATYEPRYDYFLACVPTSAEHIGDVPATVDPDKEVTPQEKKPEETATPSPVALAEIPCLISVEGDCPFLSGGELVQVASTGLDVGLELVDGWTGDSSIAEGVAVPSQALPPSSDGWDKDWTYNASLLFLARQGTLRASTHVEILGFSGSVLGDLERLCESRSCDDAGPCEFGFSFEPPELADTSAETWELSSWEQPCRIVFCCNCTEAQDGSAPDDDLGGAPTRTPPITSPPPPAKPAPSETGAPPTPKPTDGEAGPSTTPTSGSRPSINDVHFGFLVTFADGMKVSGVCDIPTGSLEFGKVYRLPVPASDGSSPGVVEASPAAGADMATVRFLRPAVTGGIPGIRISGYPFAGIEITSVQWSIDGAPAGPAVTGGRSPIAEAPAGSGSTTPPPSVALPPQPSAPSVTPPVTIPSPGRRGYEPYSRRPAPGRRLPKLEPASVCPPIDVPAVLEGATAIPPPPLAMPPDGLPVALEPPPQEEESAVADADEQECGDVPPEILDIARYLAYRVGQEHYHEEIEYGVTLYDPHWTYFDVKTDLGYWISSTDPTVTPSDKSKAQTLKTWLLRACQDSRQAAVREYESSYRDGYEDAGG